MTRHRHLKATCLLWHCLNSTVCAQLLPEDVSLAIHAFVRLGHRPDMLLQALRGMPDALRILLQDADVCAKLCFCMASFRAWHQSLFCQTMAAMVNLEEDAFSTHMRYQVAVSQLLASWDGCALLDNDANCYGLHCCCRRHCASNRCDSLTQRFHEYMHVSAVNILLFSCVGCLSQICSACRIDSDLPPFLSGKLRSHALQTVVKSEHQRNREAKTILQDQFALLQRYGAVSVNVATSDSDISIDVRCEQLRYEGLPVVIELLDDEHVASNTQQALGRWLVRQRLLAGYGYHVVPLPLDRWEQTGQDIRFVQALLAGCNVVEA